MATATLRASPATAGRRRHQWRAGLARLAGELSTSPAIQVDLTIEPGRWVDLDTLVEEVLRGLRDGGRFGRGFAGLDAFAATKRHGTDVGVVVRDRTAASLPDPPGGALLDVHGPLPRAERAAKQGWRELIAGAWGDRPPLEGDVWAAVAIATTGSLLSRLEGVLDCLEPVLGRDPRGRRWQEFFPNDDRITWLRVDRAAASDPGVRLRLGRAG